MNGTKLQRIGILLLILFAIGATVWNIWGNITNTVNIDMQIQGNGKINIEPDKNEYEVGEEITLIAKPEEEWKFVKWSGDINSEEKTINITVKDNMVIKPIFEKEKFIIDIEKSDNGNVFIKPDKGSYLKDENITLEAEPNEGWEFINWGNDNLSNNNNVEINIKEDMQIKPLFEKKKLTITIKTEGDGSYKLEPDKEKYEYGEEVTITAEPTDGWKFVEWTGDIQNEHKTVDIEIKEDMSISSVFEKNEYALDIEMEGEGNIVIEPDKEKYKYGEEVTITAEPIDGWKFIEWTGDIQNEHKTVDVKFEENISIKSIFEKKEYSLNVGTEGEGNIVIEPDKEKYKYEEEVTITAEPIEGWKFIEWTGDIQNEHKTVDIKITNNMSVKSIFEEIKYKINIEAEGEGNIILNPDKEYYDYDETVEIIAEPEQGWNFIKWSGDLDNQGDKIEIKMNKDINTKAVFETNQYKLNLTIEGNGNVVIEPTKEKYNYNEEILLTPEPPEGWSFVKWDGDINSNEVPLKINIKNDIELNSIFKKDDNIVKFEDPRLEKIIREKINKLEGDLYLSIVSDIKKIEAPGKSIRTLKGLENLKALKYIDLSKKWVDGTWNYNFITDLSPLTNLENLDYLDLSGNNIEDLMPLIDNNGLGQDDYINLEDNELKIDKGTKNMDQIIELKSRGIKVDY